MCTFCAAIPMSASVGSVLARKQSQREQASDLIESASTPRELPIRTITVLVTGGLVVCSAIYHLIVMPRTGAFL